MVTTDVARSTVGVLTGAPATDTHSGAGGHGALESRAQKKSLALAAVIALDDASAASTARGLEVLDPGMQDRWADCLTMRRRILTPGTRGRPTDAQTSAALAEIRSLTATVRPWTETAGA